MKDTYWQILQQYCGTKFGKHFLHGEIFLQYDMPFLYNLFEDKISYSFQDLQQ